MECLSEDQIASLRDAAPGQAPPELAQHLAGCERCQSRALFGPDLVVLLPIGATEPHGPHLPLDTDVTIATAQSRVAAEELERAGVRALVLPALPYGVTYYTDGFEGRVTLRTGTLWAPIIAHAVTNGVLGIWVVATGQWQFW